MSYGIDVSHWQGVIDWQKVKAAGKDFAIIKASEGSGFVDDRFLRNYKAAQDAGLAVGAYHYFRPGWDTDEQAQHFYDTAKGMDLIPWLDVEDWHKHVNGPKVSGPQYVKELAEVLVRCDELFGMTVGIYTGEWFWNQLPVTWSMDDRPLWVAYWYKDLKVHKPSTLPKGWTRYDVHQYSARGTVAGIAGNVDLNYAADLSAIQVNGPLPPPVLDTAAIKRHLQTIRASVNEIDRLL